MATHLQINPQLAQWAVQAIGRLLATFALIQGVNILLTGDERWTGDAYDYALQVPGAPETWAVALIFAGFVALASSLLGRHRWTIGGQIGVSAWCFFFASSYFLSAIDEPMAPNTGFAANAALCVASAVIAAVYVSSEIDYA